MNKLNKLIELFEKYIFSKLSEDENDIVTSHIPFHPDQDEKEELLEALRIYNQTYIQQIENSTIKLIPLVISSSINDNEITVIHNRTALLYYLKHQEINNEHIRDVIFSIMSNYSLNYKLFCDHILRNIINTYSPEEFKSLFAIKYRDGLIMNRLLEPIIKQVNDLFTSGEICFRLVLSKERSLLQGRKILNYTIKRVDMLDIARLHRCRDRYISKIMEWLSTLLPFDYPFFEEELHTAADDTIEKIYIMIRDINQDPDYNKLDTGALVQYKLLKEFKIRPNL